MLHSTTFSIVSLRQQVLYAQADDARAAQRNAHLLSQLEHSLQSTRERRQRKGVERLERWHQQLRDSHVKESKRLKEELARVQARRERARVDFESELAAREEGAACEQALRQQLELERFEAAARAGVRLGVDSHVRAAEREAERSMAEAVDVMAAETQAVVEAQVRRQLQYIANELPSRLHHQAERALQHVERAGKVLHGSDAFAGVGAALAGAVEHLGDVSRGSGSGVGLENRGEERVVEATSEGLDTSNPNRDQVDSSAKKDNSNANDNSSVDTDSFSRAFGKPDAHDCKVLEAVGKCSAQTDGPTSEGSAAAAARQPTPTSVAHSLHASSSAASVSSPLRPAPHALEMEASRSLSLGPTEGLNRTQLAAQDALLDAAMRARALRSHTDEAARTRSQLELAQAAAAVLAVSDPSAMLGRGSLGSGWTQMASSDRVWRGGQEPCIPQGSSGACDLSRSQPSRPSCAVVSEAHTQTSHSIRWKDDEPSPAALAMPTAASLPPSPRLRSAPQFSRSPQASPKPRSRQLSPVPACHLQPSSEQCSCSPSEQPLLRPPLPAAAAHASCSSGHQSPLRSLQLQCSLSPMLRSPTSSPRQSPLRTSRPAPQSPPPHTRLDGSSSSSPVFTGSSPNPQASASCVPPECSGGEFACAPPSMERSPVRSPTLTQEEPRKKLCISEAANDNLVPAAPLLSTPGPCDQPAPASCEQYSDEEGCSYFSDSFCSATGLSPVPERAACAVETQRAALAAAVEAAPAAAKPKGGFFKKTSSMRQARA
ncbi:MAG: hypothetical protein SGPRY_003221 [Prymnesium sp.]